MLLYTWQEAGKEGRLILSSGAKYNQINFSKNHVSGNARKIGVTFIWWFTIGLDGRKGESFRSLPKELVRISPISYLYYVRELGLKCLWQHPPK